MPCVVAEAAPPVSFCLMVRAFIEALRHFPPWKAAIGAPPMSVLSADVAARSQCVQGRGR